MRFERDALPATSSLLLNACVDAVCGSQPYRGLTSTATDLWVPLSPVPEDADTNVSVRVTVDARVVFTASTHVRSRKFQPNGPGCDPVVWDVSVTAHPGNVLTPTT